MSFRIGCLLLFVLALSMRVLHVVGLRGAPFFDLLLGDARGYDAWARRIAEGEWIGTGVFYQAPFYPYFLGSIYAFAGDDVLVVRLVQALLGAGACVLLADAGRRLFSPPAGLLAGSMLAIYAPALFFDGLIQKASLAMFLWCATLWLLARIVEAPRTSLWGWLGAALGALALTRENTLAVVAVVALWLWLQHRSAGRRRFVYSAALLAGLALTLAPVALRNYALSGEFHLTTSQLGPNFYIGNNRDANGAYMPLQRGRGDPLAEQTDAKQLAEAELGRELGAGEVSDYWLERSFEEIREDPAHWLALLVRKLGLVWNATEIGDTEFLEGHAEWSPVLRVTSRVLHFGWIVPLAVFGLWATWPDRRRLWLFYALAGTYVASVVAFYVMARYRYPLVPLLLLFAGAGIARAVPSLRAASPGQRLAVGVAVIASAITCNLPIAAALSPRWVADYNVGSALLAQGRNEAAIESLGRALTPESDELLVHTQLGIALHRAGRDQEAEAEFRAALELNADFVDALIGLSRALAALGREAEALAQLRRAGALAPESTRPLNNAAWLLATSTQIDERTARRALRMARRANELAQGEDPMILDTLAAAHAASGQFEEAVAIEEEVLARALAEGDGEFAQSVKERLALYRNGRRFVEPRAPLRGSP